MSDRKLLLGARIKELRKRLGLSQDQLAEKVGIEAKYLSRIEVGKRYPSLETLEDISDALGVEMKELFDYSHHDIAKIPQEISDLAHNATTEQLMIIHRVIKAVIR